MISGEQLREVLRLLGWSPADLAERADLRITVILDGLASDRAVRLGPEEETRLRHTLGEAGIIVMDRHRRDLGIRYLPQ